MESLSGSRPDRPVITTSSSTSRPARAALPTALGIFACRALGVSATNRHTCHPTHPHSGKCKGTWALWTSTWLPYSIDPLLGCYDCSPTVHYCSISLGECPRRGCRRVSRVRDRARLKGRDSRGSRPSTSRFHEPGARLIAAQGRWRSRSFSLRVFLKDNSRVFSSASAYCGESATLAATAWAAESPVVIEATSARAQLRASVVGALPRPLRPSRDYLRHQVRQMTSRALPTHIRKHESIDHALCLPIGVN